MKSKDDYKYFMKCSVTDLIRNGYYHYTHTQNDTMANELSVRIIAYEAIIKSANSTLRIKYETLAHLNPGKKKSLDHKYYCEAKNDIINFFYKVEILKLQKAMCEKEYVLLSRDKNHVTKEIKRKDILNLWQEEDFTEGCGEEEDVIIAATNLESNSNLEIEDLDTILHQTDDLFDF